MATIPKKAPSKANKKSHLRVQIRALLHKRADHKPETILQLKINMKVFPFRPTKLWQFSPIR